MTETISQQSMYQDRSVAQKRKMAKRSARRWPLYRLPPELRNVIYDLVLAGPWQTIRMPASRPALLKVCKQITSEASPIFFGLNDLYASITTADLKAFSQCLRAMGPEGADSVTHLAISLDIDLELELQRTSKYGGAGVMNYPRWRWIDVPRTIIHAGIRPEMVTLADPLAVAWTQDLSNYATRWMAEMQDGLPGARKEERGDE